MASWLPALGTNNHDPGPASSVRLLDKMLVSAALISLVPAERWLRVPAWMVVMIIGREFAVSGLRGIAAAEGYTIQASELGKTKTIAQVVAISLLR